MSPIKRRLSSAATAQSTLSPGGSSGGETHPKVFRAPKHMPSTVFTTGRTKRLLQAAGHALAAAGHSSSAPLPATVTSAPCAGAPPVDSVVVVAEPQAAANSASGRAGRLPPTFVFVCSIFPLQERGPATPKDHRAQL